MGMQRFQMFDFVLPVVIAGAIGLLYLWLVAPRMIPERLPPLTDVSYRVYEAQLTIPKNSRYVDHKLIKILRKVGPELQVRRILRGQNLYIAPLPDVRICAGDRLLVSDTISQLREFQALLGAKLHTETGLTSRQQRDDLQLAEVAVTLGSRLHDMRLGDVPLQEQYGLQVLALHDASGVLEYITPGMYEHNLQASDVLLVQGGADDISRLKVSGEMLVLDSTMDLPRTRKAPLALVIMLLVVALPAFRILPIEASSLLGVIAMIGTHCLKWRDATKALSAQVILIIVASLALGSALMKTGGADWLALVFLSVASGAPAWLMLAGLMLLMAIVTNIVSNNAAAVIGTPIAISIAMELGLPLEPFVLAVLFGANLSFVTPMAYKTNLLVMNAGGYKFKDFVKVGIPLTVVMWLALSAVLFLAYDL
jgi:uncharacterized protein with PhoU and TrkA domain